MAFNGNGTFNRLYSWASDATNGILVRSDRMDTEDNGFATGLSTVICKDGQTTTTAVIPFAVGLKSSDGTVSLPAYAFTTEPNSGWYRASAVNVALATGGVNTAQFSSSNMTAGSHYTVSSATPMLSAGTSTGYMQLSLQNKSSGTTASTDIVCTADTGTDTTNYVNFGVNSSGFTGAAPFNLALDGYLYAQSANLNIGTVASKVLNFATNNVVVGAFDASGNFSINTNKFTVAGSTGNTVVAGTLAVTGASTFTGEVIVPTPTNSTDATTKAYVDAILPSQVGNSGKKLTTNGTTASWITGVILQAGTVATQNPVTLSSTTTQAHGLGSIPDYINCWVECVTNDNGYVSGERIQWAAHIAGGADGFDVSFDATNVYIITSATMFTALSKTTRGNVTLTTANWKIVAKPFLYV